MKTKRHQTWHWWIVGWKKGGVLVCMASIYGFPNPSRRCHHFTLIPWQNNISPRAILASFKGLKPSKRACFPYPANDFWAIGGHQMMLFASFCFARLFPLRVFCPLFFPTFPPISWLSTPRCPSETTPLSLIPLLFDAFSDAFSCKKHG